MSKIKSIDITGIRGVREGLNLSLDKKSMLIDGDRVELGKAPFQML